jgi:putative acetyltransferase
MVILISGASFVGKTIMAQNLLEKYKIPYLSIDHLKMGLYRSGNDYGFTPESEDKIITEKLWPIIKGIIMTNIENNQNMIIEGCYLPDNLNEFSDEYLSKIIYFHIIFSENYIRENLFKKIFENRDVVEKREYFIENKIELIDEYILDNKKHKEKCINNGIKYFEIDNNYELEIELIYDWLEGEYIRAGYKSFCEFNYNIAKGTTQ